MGLVYETSLLCACVKWCKQRVVDWTVIRLYGNYLTVHFAEHYQGYRMASNPFLYNYGYGYNASTSTPSNTGSYGNYRPQAPNQQQLPQQQSPQQQSQQQYGVGYGQQQYSDPQRANPQQQIGYSGQQQQQKPANTYQTSPYQQQQVINKPYMSATNTVAAAAVSYPATTQSYSNNPFTVSANNYYQKQQQQGGQQANAAYTPQQAQVIQDYIKKQAQPAKKGNWWKNNQGNQQQTYYCEVCKISCVSTMTYKTHLEGKAHKKKAAGPSPTPTNVTTYRCDLCDVVCTSKDAIEAHFRGAKHQKVAKLHHRLGKPVPPTYQVVAPASSSEESSTKTVTVTATPPRINFVGGKKLSMSGNDDSTGTPKVYPPTSSASSTPASGQAKEGGTPTESDVEPVGLELVVAVVKDAKYPHAKFKCEMCECYFNDEFAKVLHCKGRRHRLNYKKSYQPDLKVEPTKQMRHQMEKKRKKEQERRKAFKADRQDKMSHPSGFYMGGPGFYKRGGGGWVSPMIAHRRPFPRKGSNPHDDKLVLNKHSAIYPTDTELKEVQTVMGEIEKALKQISDTLLEERCSQLAAKEGKEQCADMPVKKDEKMRELLGVMRVGALARGLMLQGERQMEVVLMMKSKPTKDTLQRIATLLPDKLTSSETSYSVTALAEQSAIMITAIYQPPLTIVATLTCTEMRDQIDDEGIKAERQAGVLDRPSCLAALAALRRTKWFQSMAHSLPSCVIVLRVFKDMCNRYSGYKDLTPWVQELVVQKCIASANPDYSKPGDVLRRLIECISSGMFLPGFGGLLDPCERDQVDSIAYLTPENREVITYTAQHMLRQIAFGKLHSVLGIEPLPQEEVTTTNKRGSTSDNGAPASKVAKTDNKQ